MSTIPLALRGAILFTALAAFALVAHVWIGGPGGTAIKMIASTGFLAIALAAGTPRTGPGRVLLAGLFACWWGDYFLTRSGDGAFLIGLVAFLLGHVGFAIYFIRLGVRPGWCLAALALLTPPGAAIHQKLAPHLGTMHGPVIVYMIVISLMLALAIGARGRGASRLIPLGAALFYLSDLLVARERFLTSSPWNPTIGLALYYAAQITLAASPARPSHRDGPA